MQRTQCPVRALGGCFLGREECGADEEGRSAGAGHLGTQAVLSGSDFTPRAMGASTGFNPTRDGI